MVNNPYKDYHVVHVPLSSFLESMQERLENVNISFNLIGGKNPLALSDQRACDMYALTYMTYVEKNTTEAGFEIAMKHRYAFNEGLEAFCDSHFFSSIHEHLPACEAKKTWQLQQISLAKTDPKADHSSQTNIHLLPMLSGQLLPFAQALQTILSKDENEQFCLLYKVV